MLRTPICLPVLHAVLTIDNGELRNDLTKSLTAVARFFA